MKNRYFNLNVTTNPYHSVLYKYQNARYAIFTDMIENSMLDFIVVSEPDDSSVPTISPIYNNIQGDSFFIKARMVTDDTVGSPVRGASVKAVLTNLNDQKFVVTGSDAGQTTYGSLTIPNMVIGVGRSNNFVEMFTVSTYQNGTRSIREWSPIIPKSVLYIYSNMEKDSAEW
jgi:integrin alpha FG-GAP repeat containing protein 1